MHRFNSTLLIALSILMTTFRLKAQKQGEGSITGNILENGSAKPIPGATVAIIPLTSPSTGQSMATSAEGTFTFNRIPYGTYRLRISAVGFTALSIDSIYIRSDRPDFSFNDVKLNPKSSDMDAVVVYAEKPLVQSRNGNITFNAAESPMSAGASASEVLRNVPLVSTDANGNLTVRGKTPKVLIDEKPVNLDARQLQDLLDALPGNMIEKIEVLTNPPPEYANEEGGVLSITTRKGRIGIGGRVSIYGGTRGEAGANTNISYRQRNLSLNASISEGYTRSRGNGWSARENIYADSTNYLHADNSYTNNNTRPNARISLDYDLDKRNSLSSVFQINRNNFSNHALADYASLNAQQQPYNLSERTTTDKGNNTNPYASLGFRHKGRLPEEVLEITTSGNLSANLDDRSFYQQYRNPDGSPTDHDSTQRQHNLSHTKGYDFRSSYDRPLDAGGKTLLSVGGSYIYSSNRVEAIISALDKSTGGYPINDALSSDLNFVQARTNMRLSLRRTLAKGLVASAGTVLTRTLVRFDLYNTPKTTTDTYWNWLPFGNISKTWDDQWSLTLVYRRVVRKPGLDEMNPSIDYSDPYNIRTGNPRLRPALGHEFDLYVNKSTAKYYFNYSLGCNILDNIYAQITTLQPGGVTWTTWQNISNRTEYNMGTWSGYNFTRALRANIGANYIYTRYGAYDHTINKYQDNGSFSANVNMSYNPSRTWSFSASSQFNRYGSPQGVSSSTVNMNLAIQHKLFQRHLIITLNVADPFIQQEYTSHTHGPNFNVDAWSASHTRNYRLTLSYDWNRTIEKGRKQLLKAAHKNDL